MAVLNKKNIYYFHLQFFITLLKCIQFFLMSIHRNELKKNKFPSPPPSNALPINTICQKYGYRNMVYLHKPVLLYCC